MLGEGTQGHVQFLPPSTPIFAPSFPSKALDMYAKFIAASEMSTAAKKYIQHHHADTVGHLFDTMEEHISGTGKCATCRKCCTIGVMSSDILVAGLCCHAFSMLRHRKGNTASSQCAESHPGYVIVFKVFFEMLDTRKPKSFLVEEVVGFTHRIPGTSTTYLEAFTEMASERGYHVRSMRMDARLWSEWPRPRVYIFGILNSLGGNAAADWVATCIQEHCSSSAHRVDIHNIYGFQPGVLPPTLVHIFLLTCQSVKAFQHVQVHSIFCQAKVIVSHSRDPCTVYIL